MLRDLLSDLDLWNLTNPGVEKSLYEFFLDLLGKSTAYSKILREYRLAEKLLGILKKSHGSPKTEATLLKVTLTVLLLIRYLSTFHYIQI